MLPSVSSLCWGLAYKDNSIIATLFATEYSLGENVDEFT